MCEKGIWKPAFNELIEWCDLCGTIRKKVYSNLAEKFVYVYKKPKQLKMACVVAPSCDFKKKLDRDKKIGKELARIKSPNFWKKLLKDKKS